MRKGIVMDIRDKKAIVMTPDGEFVKVRRVPGGCEIGDEIAIPASGYPGGWNRIRMTAASAFAAAVVCFVIVFAGFGGFWGAGRAEAVAYVAMDFNPSVELGINEKEVVVTAEGLNPDGEQVVAHAGLVGLTLEEAAVRVIEAAKELDFLNRFADREAGNVVITVTVVNETAVASETRLNEVVSATVKQKLQQQLPKTAESIRVDVIEAPVELREEARSIGVSPGTMAVLLLAEEQGYRVTNNGNASIDDIAREVGGIGNLTKSDGASTKERLKELVKLYRERAKRENRQQVPGTSESRVGGVIAAAGKADQEKSRKKDEKDVRRGKGLNDKLINRSRTERRNENGGRHEQVRNDRDVRNGMIWDFSPILGWNDRLRDAHGKSDRTRDTGSVWSDRSSREDRDRDRKAVQGSRGSQANGGTGRYGDKGDKSDHPASDRSGQSVRQGGVPGGMPRTAIQQPPAKPTGPAKKGDERSVNKNDTAGGKESRRNGTLRNSSGNDRKNGAESRNAGTGIAERGGADKGIDHRSRSGHSARDGDGGRNVQAPQQERKDRGSVVQGRGEDSSRDKVASSGSNPHGNRKDRESAAAKPGTSNPKQNGNKNTQSVDKDQQGKRQSGKHSGNKNGQGHGNQNQSNKQPQDKNKGSSGGGKSPGGGIWG